MKCMALNGWSDMGAGNFAALCSESEGIFKKDRKTSGMDEGTFGNTGRQNAKLPQQGRHAFLDAI